MKSKLVKSDLKADRVYSLVVLNTISYPNFVSSIFSILSVYLSILIYSVFPFLKIVSIKYLFQLMVFLINLLQFNILISKLGSFFLPCIFQLLKTFKRLGELPMTVEILVVSVCGNLPHIQST